MQAIPTMEAYLKQKYGKQWKDYENKVPWKLLLGNFFKMLRIKGPLKGFLR
jgi:hypothetical protein